MNLGRETENIEFKKSTSELKEGVASVAAILNKHNEGALYFGVKNNGDICGQQVSDSTLREVSQAISNFVKPAIYPQIIKKTTDSGLDYVHVSFKGNDAPYACDGRYRIRVADEDILLSPDEVRQRFLQTEHQLNTWDTHLSEKDIGDVDEATLRAFIKRGNKCKRIAEEYSNVRDVLNRLNLIENDKLVNAAAALFCPSRYINLKMGVLATHARTEILDLKQEEGLVFNLVNKAELYIQNNTRRRFVIEGMEPRQEIPEIPFKAAHEALMNAFAHRDWAAGGSVVVDIYYDTVEITSPGWFIEGQDPCDHLAGINNSSKSRNELIVKTLYKSGDIESYGTGIPRIRNLCTAAGIKVEYKQVPEGTKLVFYRNDAFADYGENITGGFEHPLSFPPVTPPVRSLIEALKNGNRGITELLEELSLSDRKNFRTNYLNPALEAGFVERTIPDKPSSSNQAYRLTPLGKQAFRERPIYE